jgi:hypothetical protein
MKIEVLVTGLRQDQPEFEACVRCGLERKKPNGEKTRRPVIGTARRSELSLPSGLALLSSLKAQGEPAQLPAGAASHQA